MRKILSGFLATSMIVAVASSVTFAAPTPVAATASTITVDMSGVTLETVGSGFVPGTTPLSANAVLTIPTLPSGTITITVPQANITLGMNTAAIVQQFAAITPTCAGVVDAGGTTLTGASFSLSAAGNNLVLTTVATGPNSEVKVGGTPTLATIDTTNDSNLYFATGSVGASAKAGLPATVNAVDAEGDLITKRGIAADRIFKSNRDGSLMILTEKNSGVDKDQNGSDGIQSGKTVYVMIQDDNFKFSDDDYWKLKITKGTNGKYVKGVSDVSKVFSDNLYNVATNAQEAGTGGTRHRYIKIELNEIYTDDEYKLTFDARLTPKSKAVNVFGAAYGITDSDEIKINDFAFYMKNIVKDADNDWKVGVGGLMLNPLSNDWNNVVWYDEDGDLAHMKFFADSDVDKFYSKLSTKWEHADYASYFNDQDAYIFDFTGSPKLSSTSRADLEIYNPFVDEDGSETIDPSTAVIYQVIDGDLFDVTDSFEYKEGENGDMAYVTRTRFLGTYIICEKAVEEAVDDNTDVPADLVPEETTPSEVTPDNNGGGKAPANTGKYL